MLGFRRHKEADLSALNTSDLYDQNSFYTALDRDLSKAKRWVVLESPFITARRMSKLMPVIRRLRTRGIHVVINTKPPEENMPGFCEQAASAIDELQEIGVVVLLTVGHHRKLAIIDERITWEGSLNILSQNDSCEIMRRIDSEPIARQTLAFIKLKKFIG